MKNKKIQSGGGGGRVIPPYQSQSVYKSVDMQEPKRKTNFKQTPQNNSQSVNTINPFANNKPSNDDLISFKISKDVMNQNTVPQYRQVYPAPYVPVKYPAPNTPFVTGNMGRIGDNPNFFTTNNVPVINNYKIDAGGVNADHINLDDIYEDILPAELKYSKLSSIIDRLAFYSFLRSTFITYDDGDYINLNQKFSKNKLNNTNLLERVKLMEFNPFGFNKFTANPYKDLADDMVLFRSCYPMNFNNFGMKCSKNNINLNIRIYNMTVADFCANRISKNYTWDNRNVWREIAFYEFVREKIIKKKICPHFPILIGYYLCDNNKINFEKFKQLKDNDNDKKKVKKILLEKAIENKLLKRELMEELDKIRNKKTPENLPHDRDNNNNIFFIGSYVFDTRQNIRNIGYISDIIEDNDRIDKNKYILKLINAEILDDIIEVNDDDLIASYRVITNMDTYQRLMPEQRQNMDINFDPRNLNELEILKIMRLMNPTASCDKCLISITESYNFPFKLWASRIYEKDMGIANKMIHTGYHSIKVWRSILFQLLYALCTMYTHNFNIHNFNLDDNVYIKFLGKENSQFGYWKYIINNVEYYIPNYGYVVMIDSNFKNLNNPIVLTNANREYVTYKETICDVLKNDIKKQPNNNNNYNDIKKNIIRQMIDIFDFDFHYNHNHITHGGIKPENEIETLIRRIHTDINIYNNDDHNAPDNIYNLNINLLFYRNFYQFLHNKIGTKISSDDLNFINNNFIITNPKKGQIYINENDEFVICISIDNIKKYKVYTDDNNVNNLDMSLNNFESQYEYEILNIDRENDTNASNNYNILKINEISLKEYNSHTPLEQNYRLVDNKFTKENLIETYRLNT